jgi:hypothetical protein
VQAGSGQLREDVRLAVYAAFRDDARAPSPVELAEAVGCELDDVRGLLGQLDASRDLVFDGTRILMAHPFTAVPMGFSVMGERRLWWGGCAWDSFAIPHLIDDEPRVLVATSCPGCGDPLVWWVDRDRPPAGTEVAHFLTPAAHIWDDVVHACSHQRLFCSEACVDHWLEAHAQPRGYVMDLATLSRLAQGWYAGRLERGYTRREPSEAAEYFRSVGLSGPFWGLPG